MISTLRRIFRRLVPATPDSVRGDLLRLRYDRLTQTLPIFYIIIILIALAASFSAMHSNADIFSVGTPAIMSMVAVVRLFVWFKRKSKSPHEIVDTHLIAGRVTGFLVTSMAMTLIASGWSIWAWLMAGDAGRSNIATLIILGAILTLNCNMVHRLVASLTIILAIVPISLIMLIMGNATETMIGGCILILVVLQIRIIFQHHDQLVQSLVLHQQTRELANTDMLTGLANRRAFVSAMESRLADETGVKFSILMIDLDGFKLVNDRFGHLVGDALIQAVSERLRALESDALFPARLGGDEFGVILDGVNDETDLSGLVVSLTKSLSTPYKIDGNALTVRASIGTALYPENGNSFAALMQTADRALYAAKPKGKLAKGSDVARFEPRRAA